VTMGGKGETGEGSRPLAPGSLGVTGPAVPLVSPCKSATATCILRNHAGALTTLGDTSRCKVEDRMVGKGLALAALASSSSAACAWASSSCALAHSQDPLPAHPHRSTCAFKQNLRTTPQAFPASDGHSGSFLCRGSGAQECRALAVPLSARGCEYLQRPHEQPHGLHWGHVAELLPAARRPQRARARGESRARGTAGQGW